MIFLLISLDIFLLIGYSSAYPPPPGYPSAPTPPQPPYERYPSPPAPHGYPYPQPPPPPGGPRPYEGYQGYFAEGYPHPPPPPPPQHCHYEHYHYQNQSDGCFSILQGWYVKYLLSDLLSFLHLGFKISYLLIAVYF